ncbi:ergothioneine biosynthesis protein EgtB [Roseibium sediminicola]|uniref:Ergothioneine biosynthesis protein EgtB n=1 Tax=Roseibium sediminicola TaxID=2933272 RepID=A0ABT0GQV9_9HYPH|nr:ergothioneine biosynthesis protein EgtB [Roseibium sp. CAU 1639]MCK7611826.1 ergothioneine biosynthesis protein EgtB [Roseibium sp. CAU 1639]
MTLLDGRTTPSPAASALDLFERTRAQTRALVQPLTPEDMGLQSMEDASPPKWHLAHTTWFFEEFILKPSLPGYRPRDERFALLFNSYYVQAGPRHTRSKRGLLSRPSVPDVLDYRMHVEDALRDGLARDAFTLNQEDLDALITLGCHHEMQHQELLVTDLLHAFSYNPLLPAYAEPKPAPVYPVQDSAWTRHEGGLVEIGHGGSGFAYDCEGPRHKVWLEPYQLAGRPVTNAEWIAFMEDGSYETQTLWLMEGWAVREREGWDTPLYWWRQDDGWWTYTLQGARPVDLAAPVVHVSYYEADAFARWAGHRLPTEAEWEAAAAPTRIDGNFLESGALTPRAGLPGLWGDVWQWTSSAFAPYPGFRPPDGAIGEYNGKFMVNQMVLRGGSCATPERQMRASYRTFFYPHQRWQMLGLRLAADS